MGKINLNLPFAFLLLSIHVFGQQKQESVYRDLPVKKFYDVSLSRSERGSHVTYKVNEVNVDQKTYDKYQSTWEDMKNCCPCILMTYDKNDILLREAVQCGDCVVGYLKEFYPDGEIKIFGQFKENLTDDWSNINQRGYCYVADGDFLLYDELGRITHIEKWKDGEFIEQKPKGKKPEIWRFDLLVNGDRFTDYELYIDELETLELVPRYKNDHKYGDINLVVSMGILGKKQEMLEIAIEDLNAEELKRLLSKNENNEAKNLGLSISIFGDGQKLQTLRLDVVP